MRLSEIMETAVDVVNATDAAELAWQRMRMQRIRHLVVMRDGDAVGVISDRDIGGARGVRLREGRQVMEMMSGPIVTARPTTTIREAANLMRGRTIGCLPILDRGKLAGIVTVTDLLNLLGKGAERPAPTSRRTVLKGRGGPRQKPVKGE